MRNTGTLPGLYLGTLLLAMGCDDAAVESHATVPAETASTRATPTAEASATAASGPTREAKAKAKTAPRTIDEPVGGKMTIDYDFIKMEDVELEIGTALAYPKEGELEIVLVSKNIGEVECFHRFGGGQEIKEGQLALELSTTGIKHRVPFDGKAGKLEHVGYTYYWRDEDDKEGTNSGNGARKDLETWLDIEGIDDDKLKGSFKIRDEAKGTFVATICKSD